MVVLVIVYGEGYLSCHSEAEKPLLGRREIERKRKFTKRKRMGPSL